MLLEDLGFNVNWREAKGWTPIAIAAFHGHKRLCQVFMAKKADPHIANAYRKDAFQVAKDDEIAEVLKGRGAERGSARKQGRQLRSYISSYIACFKRDEASTHLWRRLRLCRPRLRPAQWQAMQVKKLRRRRPKPRGRPVEASLMTAIQAKAASKSSRGLKS